MKIIIIVKIAKNIVEKSSDSKLLLDFFLVQIYVNNQK